MWKKIITFLLVFAVLLVPCLSAYADEIPEVGLDAALVRAQEFNEWKEQRSAEQIAAELGLSVWDVLSSYGTEAPPEPLITVGEEDTWEELVYRLLDKYEADEENVGIGYYNSRTGEEHYINADEYIVSASMFKVPLNMILADRVSSGEMEMDTDIYGMPYRWYQNRSIVYSDNERSVNLMDYMGGYSKFKELQIPYLGNDPSEDLGWNYQVENFYTAREFIHMLRMLEETPERFPGILENMLEAEPFHYFRQYETRYPIAQKYGFVGQQENTGYHTYINTCGVVYTDDPFCIVVFTDNVSKAYDLISEYCIVMCDYTNRVSRQAAEQEEQLAQQRAAQAAADAAAMERASAQLAARLTDGEPGLVFTLSPVPAEESTEGSSRFHMSVLSTIIVVWILIAMFAALVVIFRHNVSGKINAFWAVLAIILAAAGLIMCVVGASFGTVIAKPSGDPQETVTAFFDAVLAEDYPAAYACLNNYSSLGLENAPEGDVSRMLYDALKESYSYTTLGPAEIDRMEAVQKVAILHLNLPALKKDAAGRVDAILEQIAEKTPHNDLYDAEGNILPSVLDDVYYRAVEQSLNGEKKFNTSSEVVLKLKYVGGRWLIEAGEELLSALSGGI